MIVRSQVIVMVRYKGYLEVVELVMETASGCEKLPRMDMDESCESFNYQLSYKFNINLNDSVLYLLQLMNILHNTNYSGSQMRSRSTLPAMLK